MNANMKITDSQEDYLEAIYHISKERLVARPKDISKYLEVRGSSVTGALKTLGAMGLINYAPYDVVTLTEEGVAVAEDIVHRHNALQRFMTNVLGIEDKEADNAACKMEHSIPKVVVERLVKYSEYVERCPKGGITWESGFGYYCKHGCSDEDCKRCLAGEKKVHE